VYLTLADVLLPKVRGNSVVYDLILVLFGSLLIAFLARISFWIGPVPITGQTFGVLMLAALLGSRRGGLAVLAYLAEGACGLGVFASGRAGLAVFASPTGGYLIGFVFSALLVGFLAERGWDRRAGTTILAMVFGNVVIYAFGLLWLCVLLFAGRLSSGSAGLLAVGLYPFIIGDVFKIFLAALLLPAGWKLIPARFREDVKL